MASKGKWLSHKATKEALQGHDKPFIEIWERGELQIELYEPRGIDTQTPHTRDEVYIVVKGSGNFMCAGETRPFDEGDVLFAPAGAEHRFIDFSGNLSVWVIFYGPEGGEKV